jgi:release factor glutamine methyltransferase
LSSTVRDALGAATDSLTAAGCDTPRLDAEVLLAAAMGIERAALVSDPARKIPPPASRRAAEWFRRRARREPVAYIVGRKGFRHIELGVDARVLVPRPDSELLVEVALGLPEGARVHDVGTGSGAVALALKHERPDLEVSASDVSLAAVEVARANAERLGLDVQITVADGLPAGPYDLVLANLPYVRDGDWLELEPDLTRWEPELALLGGEDGLGAIRALVTAAPSGTPMALEHAPGQAAAVRELLRDARTRRDLAGLERVTSGVVP